MHVIGTAGHVDHGKSTLVEALTGTDPDRLAEEKARGLTIDLGFAGCTLPSGRAMSIIDVPGHERFVKNMLAGVGAIDACLFVVAATEGWKPQSEEHLRIIELLGVRHGVVALTKVGLVDDELLELARLDVEEQVEGTFLEGAEVVAVDALAGIGLDDLRDALDRLLEVTPRAADHKRPRLWIDRVFSARGSGTVVTGTLTGGRIRVDDELLVVPGLRRVRVRSLQSHHAQRTKIGPGNRVAVNLGGIAHTELRRGHALVVEDQWRPTQRIDASLHVLESLDHTVSRRGAYVVYLGSGEHPCRLRVLGPNPLEPGEDGFIRLHLERPVPLIPGDRFVLRESGRVETVGGGEVLDIDPIMPAARATPDRSVDRVVRERGWVSAADLLLLTGERREPTIGRWVVAPAVLETMAAELRRRIDEAGPLGLALAELHERERALLDTFEGIEVAGGNIRPTGAADVVAGHPFVDALEAAPFRPPTPDGVDRGELRELLRTGAIIESEGVYFAPSAIEQATAIIADLLARQPEGFTVAEVRELIDSTRKYTLPLLAHLDTHGLTRRRGDLRIAGPRLPTR